MKRRWLLGVGLWWLLTSTVFAQEMAPPPKTQVELFKSRTGSVVVSGYTVIGRLHVPATAQEKAAGDITVTSWVFLDALSGEKMRGISVELEDQAKHQKRSYIDADEIGLLLKGIDYMSKVDRTVTNLANFEAVFQTRGDFKVSAFNEPDGSLAISIRTGSIDPISVNLPFDALGRFEKLVSDAGCGELNGVFIFESVNSNFRLQ